MNKLGKSKSRLPWFPCYPTLLLGVFARMKPDEAYVYWTVCLRIYETGGPCRDPVGEISRQTGMTSKRVTKLLELLFQAGRLNRESDGISNPFATETLADMRARHEERKKSGKIGGLLSAKKREQNQLAEASSAQAQLKLSSTQSKKHVSYLLEEVSKKEVRKEEEDILSKTPSPRSGRPKIHGTRLPDDFELSEKTLAAIRAMGFSSDSILFETERFKDHWRAATGPNAIKADWQAAARNWFRRAREGQGFVKIERSGNGQSQDRSHSALAALERMQHGGGGVSYQNAALRLPKG